MARIEKEEIITSYKGNVLLRLLSYLKNYKKTVLLISLLCLLLTAIDLIRPMIISTGIDTFINGYQKTYVKAEKSDVYFKGSYLSENLEEGNEYSSLVMYDDGYYYFDGLDADKLNILNNEIMDSVNPEYADGNKIVISSLEGYRLYKEDLAILRHNDFKGLIYLAIVYAIILVIRFVANNQELLLVQTTGQKIIKQMRRELFHHINHLPLRFFDTHPIGSLVSRTANDTEAINELYSTVLTRFCTNLVYLVGLMAMMLIINIRLALYCFILVPLVCVLIFVFRFLARKCYREARTRISQLNTFLSENLSGMRLIQIFHNEVLKFNEFKDKNNDLFKANMKTISIMATFRPLIYFVGKLAVALYLYKAAYEVIGGTITIGTLYLYFDYISNFFEPIQDIAESLQTFQSAFAAGEKVFTILDEPDTIREKDKPVILDEIKGKIEFKNVSFAYDDEDFVLKDVSFKIEPGEKVAFVGATGAGKSSILNLCGRYYDIQKGQILIDDVDIKDLSIEQLRGAIGQVQQDVFIFDGDIASNIRLLNDDISDDDIKQAAITVNADGFIEALPDKYHEKVSERGSTLSAGQRQLLSFARTLAFNPKILVMDEATANIDTQTESLIQSALENLMKDRTTIMVAHRLSTIQHADNIIVMHKGRIREQGTHQELLALNGIYKKLYELQLYQS
ncbi:MAG: ABC transporter ATP-binding protein [Erysipelotrichaceae bacterium]